MNLHTFEERRPALMNRLKTLFFTLALCLTAASAVHASEADLAIPDLHKGHFDSLGGISAWWLLFGGSWVICGTLGISLYLRAQIKALPAHKSMLDVAEVIFQTCKTYLIQQGKFLLMLFVLIALAITYYLLAFQEPHKAGEPEAINPYVKVALVLFFAVVGMGGSYLVAWYGIRINTYANCRTAFASLRRTADGFETYGVTGVALITFITLAVPSPDIQAKLIVWIFAMRFLMDFMSGVSYFVNQAISEKQYAGLKEFDFEAPLTRLIWIASILCLSTSYLMSWLLISDLTVPGIAAETTGRLWWQLASIISCGTLAAVLIPEFTTI